MASITPFLWFDRDLAEPISFYTSIFPDTTVLVGASEGPIFSATIELCGQQLILLNGGPDHAGFRESISFFVSVDTQDEIDDLWERLTANGGEPSRCGWLKDRYGLSWQVVPERVGIAARLLRSDTGSTGARSHAADGKARYRRAASRL